jgi:hypothetical protein
MLNVYACVCMYLTTGSSLKSPLAIQGKYHNLYQVVCSQLSLLWDRVSQHPCLYCGSYVGNGCDFHTRLCLSSVSPA